MSHASAETTSANSGATAVGVAFAILQAVLYSTMGIFGKVMYATGLAADQVVLLRYAAATVLLGAFLLIWRRQPLVARDRGVYLQALLAFASSASYFFAVERMNAGVTTVLFYTYPAVVAVASALLFRERITPATVAAMILALAGLLLVSGITEGAVALDPLGLGLAVASCLFFAAYTLLINKTSRTDGPLTITFTLSWVGLLGACVLFAPAVPTLATLSAPQVGLACGLALACTLLPIPLYIEAVKRIGATRTSLLGISETPSSLLLAFVILGETLTAAQGTGSLLIVASIAVTTAAPLLGKRHSSLTGD